MSSSAHGSAGVLDVDAVLDGDLEQMLALGRHDAPLGLVRAGQALGVFQEELDRDRRGAVVVVVRVSQVHGRVLERDRYGPIDTLIESKSQRSIGRDLRGGRGAGPIVPP